MVESPSPRRQLPYLIKHFFGRFFDTELIAAPHTDTHLLLVQILGLLVMPGYLKTFMSITKYSVLAWYPVAGRNHAVLLDGYFFLCLSMVLTGIVTVFEWDALFPDSKDFYNLSPLPIKPKILFFAKVIALSWFVLLFNLAINGIPTLLFPGFVLVSSLKPGTAGRFISNGAGVMYQSAHAISVLASSLFIFTSLVAIRSIFFVLPAEMARVMSRCTQLLLILTFFCILFSFPAVPIDRLLAQGSPLIYFFPPLWFVGIYQVLIGHDSLVYVRMAKMAYAAVAVSGSVSGVGYAISYRALMQKGFQSAGIASYPVSGMRKAWNRILHRAFLKGPFERASYHFVAETIGRRPEHMLYWGSFFAVGIALISLGAFMIKSGYVLSSSLHFKVLLSFPLILSFFLLVGLRFAFSVPADLDANWVFKLTGKRQLETALGGVQKFVSFAVSIPLFVIFVPGYAMVWGLRMTCLHIIYVLMLSLILIELLLYRFKKLPFTCSYIPGKTNIKLLWPAYVLAGIGYAYGSTALEQWMFKDMRIYVLVIAAAGILLRQMKRNRALFVEKMGAIQFEEQLPNEINILTIEG
jgi:hypothetical protein